MSNLKHSQVVKYNDFTIRNIIEDLKMIIVLTDKESIKSRCNYIIEVLMTNKLKKEVNNYD